MFVVLCAELAVIDDPHLHLPIGGCRGVICKFSHSVLVHYLKLFHMEKLFLAHHLLILRESYSIFAAFLYHLNISCIYSLYSFNLYYLHVIFFLSIWSYFQKSLFHKYFQRIGFYVFALLLSNSLFLHLSSLFPTF